MQTKSNKNAYSRAILEAVKVVPKRVVVLTQQLLNIALTGNSTLYKLRSYQI